MSDLRVMFSIAESDGKDAKQIAQKGTHGENGQSELIKTTLEAGPLPKTSATFIEKSGIQNLSGGKQLQRGNSRLDGGTTAAVRKLSLDPDNENLQRKKSSEAEQLNQNDTEKETAGSSL